MVKSQTQSKAKDRAPAGFREWQQSAQSFFELIDNANDAIYFHDAEGILVFMNRKAETMSGYKRDELANQHIGKILTQESRVAVEKKLSDSPSLGNETRLTLTLLTKSGRQVPIELSLTPINHKKKVVGFEGIARDISEVRKAENSEKTEAEIQQLNFQIQKKYMKLEESARIQAEFVSSISHEFRTPLNGIIGYAELLEDKVYGDLNDNQLAALQNIKACASDLLKMVQEILDLSRLKTTQLKLEMESASPNELIEAVVGAVTPVIHAHGLRVKKVSDADLPLVKLDFKRIYQILVNLVNNAVKFTRQGEIEIGATKSDGHIEFFVKDTGIGISPELQELIFHDFRKKDGSMNRFLGGMGLALSLSRRLIELHEGEFWVTSGVNCGTALHFKIPLKPKAKKRFRL